MRSLALSFLFAAASPPSVPSAGDREVFSLVHWLHEGDMGHRGHGGPPGDGTPPPEVTSKTSTFDTTTTLADGSTRHVKGSSQSTGKTNALFTVEDSKDGTFTVKITDVEKPARGTDCHWPTSGSITRNGTKAATLVFSAPCGTATLNGAAITLPSHPPFGHKPGHHQAGN